MFPSCYSKPKNGSQFKMSYTKVIFGVLVVYVLHTCWAIYGFIHTKPCDSAKGDTCVTSYLTVKPRLQLSIYSALDPSDETGHNLLFKVDKFDINTKFERKVSVTVPEMTHNNGTVHAVVFVHKSGVLPWKDSRHVRLVARLTSQMIPLQSGNREEMNSTTKAVPLTISYDTITLRKFRIWIHIQAVIYSLKHFGFSEQNLDEIKAMFVESGLHILALSVLVPAFHLSFEIFAFKNDIRFWREKKSLAGISRRSVVWRCFSTIVIFLHLLEEQSSWLILLPTGISALIELWKVKKVLALSPKFHDERMDDFERATEDYDSKLKSVAHLQWSIFMYKGLNTFISDVFSGIITTPGPHQLACFRDDVVFLIYLYQRRIYPMSKSRSRDYVNALKCYVCGSATSNQECNKNLQDCPAPLDTCMTTVGTAGGFTAIVKTCSNSKICAAAAASASVDSNGNGLQVTCCSSYLCNYSGAASVTLHRWLLVLPLLLITLLFRQHI
ncbi:cleft lip and palate transmembrane 1 [Labeo rohita]|uniref:Lipid scramblase CLPTM1L n=1 Tax=Labeo rohita TaxID=84645 RepID=A0A498LCH3_LABRO|nr:cleft lip and palate transmembrane 1 [Labeo rohita]